MEVKKSDLSPRYQHLVETMQKVNYGCIRQLQIQAGEPVFTPMTRVERQIKFGGENKARSESSLTDFVLKRTVIELFDALAHLDDGSIKQLEIKGGLPFGMTFEEQAI